MANENKKDSNTESNNESKKEIKNLFEDMNHHEHDEKSYEKMLKNQTIQGKK